MSALLSLSCDLSAGTPASYAKAILDAAGLIGRNDVEVRARLKRMSLRPAVSNEDLTLAFRLARAGVPEPQLAASVRRARLGLARPPAYCDRLTLCEKGVILGEGTVIAPLTDLSGGRIGLAIEGREADILAMLSIARGELAPATAVDRLQSVSRALQRGEKALAEVGLALIGQPVLSDRAAAAPLSKAAAGLCSGADPCAVLKAHGLAPLSETLFQGQGPVNKHDGFKVGKASPDDPKHPGWPKHDPQGRGGQFRPKDTDAAPGQGPPVEEPSAKPSIFGIVSQAVFQAAKFAVRQLVKAGVVAADVISPEAMAALGIGMDLADAAYPFVKAYFDPPRCRRGSGWNLKVA
jgi:hypothetical protein